MRTDISKIENPRSNASSRVSMAAADGLISNLKKNNGYTRTDISLNKYYEVEELRSKFYFDSDNLDSFLLDNYELVKFLQRAHLQLSEILPSSIFILEVNNDFEVDDWKTLFVNVINNLQDSTFDDRLQDFILNWMFTEKPEIRKLVTVKEIC